MSIKSMIDDINNDLDSIKLPESVAISMRQAKPVFDYEPIVQTPKFLQEKPQNLWSATESTFKPY